MGDGLVRIRYLDGVRGLAILLVMGFHAYSRWSGVLPFGDAYAGFPPFAFGGYGVYLFFLLSGYVILMTMEKTERLALFFKKRWLRLFPGMLIASVLLYLSSFWLVERPEAIQGPFDMVPGITFIDPYVWNRLLPFETASLDGAFWSIYVEVLFYLIFGVLYYVAGKRRAVPLLGAIYLAQVALMLLSERVDALSPLYGLAGRFGFDYYGLFVSGAFLYLYRKSGDMRQLLASGAAAVLAAFFCTDGTTGAVLTALILYALFVLPLFVPLARRVFESRFLVFMGFVSYPLYLIHQNAMVALAIKMDRLVRLPGLLVPVLPYALLILVAYAIAKLGEPRLAAGLRRLIVRECKA